MNKAFWNGLPEIVRHIDREALARVLVISSTGKHFSAGMDLSVFSQGAGSRAPDSTPMLTSVTEMIGIP